jgi:hypothetical protein
VQSDSAVAHGTPSVYFCTLWGTFLSVTGDTEGGRLSHCVEWHCDLDHREGEQGPFPLSTD